MSLGRVSSFLDVYFERDLADGVLSEVEAQEIVDHFVKANRRTKGVCAARTQARQFGISSRLCRRAETLGKNRPRLR